MITCAEFPLTQLLKLVTKAVGGQRAGLFLAESGSEDFAARLVEPDGADESLSKLILGADSPVTEYLRRKHKILTRKKLSALPEFNGSYESEKEGIKTSEIELLVPLINHDRLMGILALEGKVTGGYTTEDFTLLEDFAHRVAESIDIGKEYLLEQSGEYAGELSVINRSSAIITSSLDIHRTYDSFIEELKKVVDVSWAAIALIEGDEIHFQALSSEIGSPWQLGERIPIKGTATEWIASNRRAVIEHDLLVESRFATGEHHLRQGVRSIAYLPLIIGDEVIGSLIVASQRPNAYIQRHIDVLGKLASRIAVPVENSRLYARAQRMARIDELTGLMNRRSLDEIINSEINRHSRYGGVLSLIILDVDSMKKVNDNQGHLAGDKILRQVGSILTRTIRKSDHGFRFGGDEFAVLLPQTSIDAAMHLAERIRLQVASGTKGSLPTTASLGLASWPAEGIKPDEVIAAADAALYQAKRSGGNRIQHYQASSLISNYTVASAPRNDDSEVLSTIYFMAAAVDARNHYTGDHSRKVNKYAVAMGKALNLEAREISRISACALLHDIGKVGINDEILNKTGKLTDEEWKIIKSHPQLGATIASHVHQLSPYIPGILYHHEWYDGSGYPEGIKGEEIPLEARILAVADAFAAMTSARDYSAALPYEEAIKEIKAGAGTQFDPSLVEVFLSICREVSTQDDDIVEAESLEGNATPVATGGFK